MGTVQSCLENFLEFVAMKIVIFFIISLIVIIQCDEDERVFGKRRCKRPKGNRGDIIYKGCKQYTCLKKDNFKNKYGWKESFASGKCCLIEDTGYPVGSVIFSETTIDGCTTSALSCENIGGIAKFRIMIKNMCPFCPTTPVFTTAAGYGNGSSSDWNFCSVSAPCSLGQGDCDSDSECANSLICGPDNCRDFNPYAESTADCCIPPGTTAAPAGTGFGNGSSSDWTFCSASAPCSLGQGDCDSDTECANSLLCGADNCGDFHPGAESTADCCILPAGNGTGTSSDWDFCSVSAPCSLGHGDCDSDAECAHSLICGADNCGDFDVNADSAADCCIASVRGNGPRNNSEDKDEKDIKNKNDKDNENNRKLTED